MESVGGDPAAEAAAAQAERAAKMGEPEPDVAPLDEDLFDDEDLSDSDSD